MRKLPRRIVVAQTLAFLAALAIVLPSEFDRWQAARAAETPWSSWFFGINIDTTLPLLLMIVWPYFWFVRRPFWSPSGRWWETLKAWWTDRPAADSSTRERSLCRGTLAVVVLIAATSLGASARVAAHSVGDREQYRFGNLPPAYHDEFSYLFQAQTYLAGRLSFPSHPTAARLFDQMHVVNEGRFAGRYFPATGLFVAPWLWLGWPILGHWLAGAATAVLVFGIGRELSNNGTGFVAGLLTALSPGMGLFGNLVLAHHPTLLGLFFFAWSFLRWMRLRRLRDVAFAGIGLSWAMLCRPMTAAGFGACFGFAYAANLWGTFFQSVRESWPNSDPRSRHLLRTAAAMSFPFCVAFGVLAIHNRSITGNYVKTPYQLFTEIYTPRHVYGFNNVVRGEQHLGPRVLDNYDRWAVNLTPALAIENSKNRLIASWQWTVGVVPLLAASVLFVLTGNARDR
ncbi:MAG TPA: glycosyltransferase family 39 protein, partial [Planctomycetaceae bacterium]|nr:glycosyltransferase family 39 protein [Planctomycetaceae bacterium]